MSQLTIRTHCANGHDLIVVGVYRVNAAESRCKVCHRESMRRSSRRLAALRSHREQLLPKEIPRFMKKITKEPSGCWVWSGATNGTGYGVFNVAGMNRLAHRVSYRNFRADFDDNCDLDHLCRNPSCVNPEHLDPVSHVENIARGNSSNASRIRELLDAGVEYADKKAGRMARSHL